MKTLIKHFKSSSRLAQGTYLACRMSDDAFVIAPYSHLKTKGLCIVNVLTGEKVSTISVQGNTEFLSKKRVEMMLEQMCLEFPVGEGKTKSETFEVWFKINKSELLGRIARNLFGAKND